MEPIYTEYIKSTE